MVTYRKTKQGEWVAYGPAAVLRDAAASGAWVSIAKRSGAVDQATIARVGRPFTVDGTEMAYGYTATTVTGTVPRAAAAPGPAMCGNCGERRAVKAAADMSGITGDVCGVCARDGHLSFA